MDLVTLLENASLNQLQQDQKGRFVQKLDSIVPLSDMPPIHHQVYTQRRAEFGSPNIAMTIDAHESRVE